MASIGFPAAIDAAGENLPIRGNGQAYLAGGDRASAVGQKPGEEVGGDGGRETRGVGVDEKEQRLVAKNLFALGKQRPEVVFEPPELALAAAAVGGWIHDDGVVAMAAALLAPDEFQAIVREIADGRVGQPAERGVFAAPLDHAL